MALVGLLAALAACGGSDTTTNNTTPGGTTDDPDTTPDPIADVPNDQVGLGTGVGDAYVHGIASNGLNDNEVLAASGNTTVKVSIVNLEKEFEQFLGLRNVYFVSSCSQIGLAEFTPATLQASGEAESTYLDKGCGREFGATDKVVVYIGTDDGNGTIIADATATTTIDVAAAQVGAVQFVAATPNLIALNGFGTEETPSLSEVKFKVVDESGNPMPSRTVLFSLDHEFGSAALSLTDAITDQDGEVVVILNAGNASGTIRVKAGVEIKDDDGNVIQTIVTQSIPLTMATSLADEDSSSIAMDLFNPSAWSRNGEEANITVHLGDHYQNPVIDGTTVYFRATGGIIEPQCETSGGACSVKWTSANPRPVDGYVTIVAYTRGQGSYHDLDGDGLFDLGESFTSFGESYVDANGNGTFDSGSAYQPDLFIDGNVTQDFNWNSNAYQVNVDNSGTYEVAQANFYEEFIDSNNNGVLDEDAGLFYQGVNCEKALLDLIPGLAENAGGHCKDQIDIVLTTRLQMSQSNSAYIEGPFLWDSVLGRYDTSNVATCVDASQTGGVKSIAWRVADSSQRRNHLPNGTKVSLSTNDVDVLSSNTGDVGSIYPAQVLPVWESASGNGNGLTGDAKRYAYLAERGHLFTANILRPETFTTVTGIGTVNLEVDTNHGPKFLSSSLNVDLQGKRITLASNLQGVVASIDVTDSAQNFTVIIKNACNEGLDAGTLVITTTNGVITAPGVATNGSAETPVLTGNGMEATVNSTGAPTVVTFTLTKDADSGGTSELNALNITLKVPNVEFGYDDFTNIADYSVKD